MTLQEEFEKAFADVARITKRPSVNEMLDLYGLYNQGSEGDVQAPRPTGFNFKEIAKHDAWTSRKGMSREEAMKGYIAEVARLIENYS